MMMMIFFTPIRRLLAKTICPGKVALVGLFSLSSTEKAQSFNSKRKGRSLRPLWPPGCS